MEHSLDAIATRETRRRRIAVGSVCAVAAIATLLPHSERGLLPWGRTPSAFAAMAGRNAGSGAGGGGGLTAPTRLALSPRERLPVVADLDPVSRAVPAGAVDYADRGDESGFVDEGVAGLTAPASVSIPLALVAPGGVPAATGGGATTTSAGGLPGGGGGFAGGGNVVSGTGSGDGTGTTPTATATPPVVTPTPPAPAIGAGVPEPATWAMLLLGFGAIGASLRRVRRSAATA